MAPLAALCACFPASKSLGEGETDAMGSTSGSASASASGQDSASGTSGGSQGSSDSGTATEGSGTAASGTDTSTTGSLDCLDQDPPLCEQCDPGCEGGWECVEGNWECYCECSDTTGGIEVCELEPIVTEVTLNTKTLPDDVIDCGYLTLDDPAMAWQAGHDCAVLADSQGETFRLLWDIQGIDSFPSQGIAGLQGFVYGRMQYFEDKGGLVNVRTVSERPCTQFVIPEDCTVDVGLMCLSCESTEDPTTICSDPQ